MFLNIYNEFSLPFVVSRLQLLQLTSGRTIKFYFLSVIWILTSTNNTSRFITYFIQVHDRVVVGEVQFLDNRLEKLLKYLLHKK